MLAVPGQGEGLGDRGGAGARARITKEAAEDLADAARRGELPAKDAATLASEERAREAHKRAMRDPTNARRG